MKHKMLVFAGYLPWLLLLLAVDALAALLLWLADVRAFRILILAIVLFSVLLFAAVFLVLAYKEHRKMQAFEAFLANPDEAEEERLKKTVSASEKETVHLLGNLLRSRQLALMQAQDELADYEEYTESWAHEIKTPLSLLTLLLDNRWEEMPEHIGKKLDSVRNRMQESVNQMLYYARLKGTQKDYLFEELDLGECIEEVLGDYRPLLEEKGFRVRKDVREEHIFSDARGICFILGQAVSNAVKYSAEEPTLDFTFARAEKGWTLRIADNGRGVPACDLPYIFEKGFTGSGSGKATGMGLYLAKKMADDLKLVLDARSEDGKGFELSVTER